MKPILPRSKTARGSAVRSHVTGWAASRVPLEHLPALRQRPGILQGAPLAPSFLKHSDEQTVAGIAAVSRAIQEHNLQDIDFSQWGVIASPRFLGRAALALALARFAAEGAWGISPHLIPHRSLHALSGTVSQALKIHGPNYGVGGGADGAAESLLAGSALLSGQELPGVWIVLTGFDPELVPNDPVDQNAKPPVVDCLAVALALRRAETNQEGTFLTVNAIGGKQSESWPDFSLQDFASMLELGATIGRWRLRTGGWATWEHAKAAVEICA